MRNHGSILLVLLVLNLSWLPTEMKVLAGPDDLQRDQDGERVAISTDCHDPIGLSVIQSALWERLGWNSYTWCDSWATYEDEIYEEYQPDPNDPLDDFQRQSIIGLWGDNSFELRIDACATVADWGEIFADDPNLAQIADEANANAGLFTAVMNDSVRVYGLFAAIDDFHSGVGRYRLLTILDWHELPPPMDLVYPNCVDEAARREYLACLRSAKRDLDACRSIANNNWENCVRSGAMLHGLAGGVISCLIAAIAKGAGALSVKATIAYCLLGVLANLLLNLLECNSTYNNDIQNCLVYYRRDLEECCDICWGTDQSSDLSEAPYSP